jgi:hypothetical protein
VPGAFYCANADCTDAAAPFVPGGTGGSTGRIDPPWVSFEGWQGFSGQNSFLEFVKKPYAVGETGGIHGEVIYTSTRPFHDPALLIHTSWTPDVPGVTINLYKEGTAPDGSTSLTLVDTTKTSSSDDWAQGFRSDGNPNMNCPGQSTTDLFYFTLFNQPMYLDMYNNGGTPTHTIPNNSQFKCFDGMHNWNQLQPAPYDGYYTFPSVTGINPTTGKPTGTNCTACVPNPTFSRAPTQARSPTGQEFRMATYQRGKYWWYRFRFAGERIEEPTKSTSRTVAKEAERQHRRALEAGYNNFKEVRQNRVRILEEIIDEYLTGYRLATVRRVLPNTRSDMSAVFSVRRSSRRYHRNFGSPLPGGPAPREGRAKVNQ